MKVSKGNKLDLAKAARECASMAESVSGTIQSITQHWNRYCNAAAMPEFVTNEVFTRRAKLADFMRRMAESLESVADDKTTNEGKETAKIYNTLKGETLQHWLTIAIKRDENGDATVTTNSTIHVNMVHPVSFSWGPEYSDADILNDDDLLRVVYQRFGREIFTADHTRNF